MSEVVFDLQAAFAASGWVIDEVSPKGESFDAHDHRFRVRADPEADVVSVALLAGFDRWAVSRLRTFPVPWDRVQWIGLQIALDDLWDLTKPEPS